MGKASARSDVFAVGLLIHRMITGHLPGYPFTWPFRRNDRLRRKARPEFIEILRRSMEVDSRKRFRDAAAMYEAYLKTGQPVLFLK